MRLRVEGGGGIRLRERDLLPVAAAGLPILLN